jgi:hypothetical protein
MLYVWLRKRPRPQARTIFGGGERQRGNMNATRHCRRRRPWWHSCTRRLVQTYSSRLVLEVLGGAGAIWGSSQALGLRRRTLSTSSDARTVASDASTATNNEYDGAWRIAAIIVSVLFSIRLVLQMKNDDDLLLRKEKRRIRQHHHHHYHHHAHDDDDATASATSTTTTTTTTTTTNQQVDDEKKNGGRCGDCLLFFETLAVTFVLEVLGAVGAIW